MLYRKQYSSAVQWIHMYEDLRRNLYLKQMTVWADEADPRLDTSSFRCSPVTLPLYVATSIDVNFRSIYIDTSESSKIHE